MTIDEARELFGYASWATARMFAAAESLPSGDSEAPAAGSFPSIRATLAHIVGAEWVWLRRWLGENPASMPAWVGGASTLGELQQQLEAVETERAVFIAGLSDPDLDRVLSYRGFDGQAFSHVLGQLIRHVVNHSTYHRGQAAAQLRHLGHTPPNTDFTRYLREAGSGSSPSTQLR